MVGSYLPTKIPWTNWTVNALLPTPPLPKTTNLYSRIIWSKSERCFCSCRCSSVDLCLCTRMIFKGQSTSDSIVWQMKNRDDRSAMTVSLVEDRSNTQKTRSNHLYQAMCYWQLLLTGWITNASDWSGYFPEEKHDGVYRIGWCSFYTLRSLTTATKC